MSSSAPVPEISATEQPSMEQPVKLPRKAGWLEKFAVGSSSFFGKSNWTERYFTVTADHGLAYYTNQLDADRKPTGFKRSIPIFKANPAHLPRLIVAPTKKDKPESDMLRDFVMCFHENGKDYELLVRCPDATAKAEWVGIIRAHIHAIPSVAGGALTYSTSSSSQNG